MENSSLLFALIVAVFVILIAIYVRQGEFMLMLRRILARTDGMAGDDERKLGEQISGMVAQNRKREAIRLYRTSYGASLAEAVVAVEKLARHDP